MKKSTEPTTTKFFTRLTITFSINIFIYLVYCMYFDNTVSVSSVIMLNLMLNGKESGRKRMAANFESTHCDPFRIKVFRDVAMCR